MINEYNLINLSYSKKNPYMMWFLVKLNMEVTGLALSVMYSQGNSIQKVEARTMATQ